MSRVQHSIGSDGTKGQYLTTVFEHERGASCDICMIRVWLAGLSGLAFGSILGVWLFL